MTTTRIDLKHLEDAIDYANVEGLKYYGEYGGRGSFKGIGVAVRDGARWYDLASAIGRYADEELEGDEAKAMRDLAYGWDHSDSLGLGTIYAWSLRRFES